MIVITQGAAAARRREAELVLERALLGVSQQQQQLVVAAMSPIRTVSRTPVPLDLPRVAGMPKVAPSSNNANVAPSSDGWLVAGPN